MTIIQSLILGLVQGLTEFLPISSSAHLVFFEKILQVEAHNLVFEVMVHVGTLAAVVIFFRKKLYLVLKAFFAAPFKHDALDDRNNLKLAWSLILATVPAAVIGLLFKEDIERAFTEPKWAAAMLLVTAAVLIATHWAEDRGRKINLPRAITIGLAQAAAIMPGISRSGSTISTGLFTGMEKGEAAEFSFLLSIPAILGAAVVEIPDFLKALANTSMVLTYAAGGLAAAIVGYLSIAYLLNLIKRGKFYYFGIYCAVAGILGLLLL